VRKTDPVKHEEKRRAILEAAKLCFIRDGFRGASISEICAQADMSPGHLYHYFASKEAIIAAMTEVGLELATARLSRIMDRADAVKVLIHEVVWSKTGDGASQSLLPEVMAEAGRNPVVADVLRDHTRRLCRLLADFLRQAQERGQIHRTLDPVLVATVLLSVVQGGKAVMFLQPDVDPARANAFLETMLTRCFIPDPHDD
jgi:AcrR family transcriptional regulator